MYILCIENDYDVQYARFNGNLKKAYKKMYTLFRSDYLGCNYTILDLNYNVIYEF